MTPTTSAGHRDPDGEVLVVDHLVYGAPVLDDAVDELEAKLGIRAATGGQHPDLGTHNALVGLGPRCYLEIIAPDPTLEAPPFGRPFCLDAVDRAGLVGWALGTTDIDLAIARARAAGYDPGDPVAVHRTTPDGTALRWRLTINALMGGSIPFLIDWGACEHPGHTAPAGLELVSLRVEDPEPDGIGRALRAMGSPVGAAGADRWALTATIDGPLGRTVLRGPASAGGLTRERDDAGQVLGDLQDDLSRDYRPRPKT